jgi:hypothetical protein
LSQPRRWDAGGATRSIVSRIFNVSALIGWEIRD